MKYNFHQAVRLGGITFIQGVHNVSPEIEKDPYFIRLVELNKIIKLPGHEKPKSTIIHTLGRLISYKHKKGKSKKKG